MEVLVHQLQNLSNLNMIKNNQMKYNLILFVFLMCLINSRSSAQLGIGTNSPNASAMLDITATNKGLLIPRMTNSQKNAISSPATGLIVFCTDCGTAGLMNIYNGTNWVRLDGNISNTPSITTSSVSAITATSATCGGNITSIGGSNVTDRGVCWSTSPYPTTANSITNSGATSVTGSFTSSITGLTSNTTYYVRAYATNSSGTSYGDQTSFNTLLALGSAYAGGIVGYLKVSGDAGYDANVQHGLIVSSNNLINTGATWGCNTSVTTSATRFTGAANTAAIIASNCATANTAAKLCNDYSVTVNGITYDDWYLPSVEELQLFYDAKPNIGNMGDLTTQTYCSSTQDGNVDNYQVIYFASCCLRQISYASKTITNIYAGVRAARSF